MKKLIITVAQFIGFISLAEAINNKRGVSLLNQFEQGILNAEEHAKVCRELAKTKELAATAALKKASDKVVKLEKKISKAERIGDGKFKAKTQSAKQSIELGVKSEKFATNLKKLVS